MALGFEYVFPSRPLDSEGVTSSIVARSGKDDWTIPVTVKPVVFRGVWILFFDLKKPLHIGVG
jgi:hypothetical protein